MEFIIYNQENGTPAVLIPTKEALSNYKLIEIAIKDVPAGKRFKIVDESELPKDIPQEFWTIDDADLTDGIGGESNEFEPKEDAVIEQGGDV